MKIKNIAGLKRALQVGVVIKTINHQKPELVGSLRQVTKVQTNGVYTVILGQPEHKWSKCNGGLGSWMGYSKPKNYVFGETIKWFNHPIGTAENNLIMEICVLNNTANIKEKRGNQHEE